MRGFVLVNSLFVVVYSSVVVRRGRADRCPPRFLRSNVFLRGSVAAGFGRRGAVHSRGGFTLTGQGGSDRLTHPMAVEICMRKWLSVCVYINVIVIIGLCLYVFVLPAGTVIRSTRILCDRRSSPWRLSWTHLRTDSWTTTRGGAIPWTSSRRLPRSGGPTPCWGRITPSLRPARFEASRTRGWIRTPGCPPMSSARKRAKPSTAPGVWGCLSC